MTSAAATRMIHVNELVKVALSELVDRDLESFLDLLDELTAPPDPFVDDEGNEGELGLLAETDYQLLGVGDEPNTVWLRVTGYREFTPFEFDGDADG